MVVRHLNKSGRQESRLPWRRIIGAARTGMLVAKDPDDEDQRVLSIVKSNLAAHAPSLEFALSEADNGAVRVNWCGEINLFAADFFTNSRPERRPSALEEATGFLQELLANGAVSAEEAEAAAGINLRTLRRARGGLGVRSEREGEPGRQGGGRWVWSLPQG